VSARLAWAHVALLCACAIPDLDTAGNIRCGTDGVCPDGYQCRIGRCCPAGAALNACPVIPAGTPGAPCPATSLTCTANLGARQVAGTCATNFPGGYCTVTGCDVNNSEGTCGPSAACVPSGTAANCVRRCTFDPSRPQPQSCRDLPGELAAGATSAYVCIKDPYDRSVAAGLCVPDCTRLNYCGANTTCDATTRGCVPIDCRRAMGVCEPMGQSCDASNGQCFRCADVRGAECTRAGRPCVLTLGSQCRQRCGTGMPCPTGASCLLGSCNR
jgi:hypothetical protein